ncbi:hypothetical protein CDCA_CDCA12G3362 [Cyanidium caldarium]|uniref:Uncharacterized protein n=1 Tax=Cyanidium caldarium TaxID=2771 RepID=A0AAV9IYJ1_CYACA|nr:hypothetical protein CDCA_CDCA12G3362 [Cyanidium caldarium]
MRGSVWRLVRRSARWPLSKARWRPLLLALLLTAAVMAAASYRAWTPWRRRSLTTAERLDEEIRQSWLRHGRAPARDPLPAVTIGIGDGAEIHLGRPDKVDRSHLCAVTMNAVYGCLKTQTEVLLRVFLTVTDGWSRGGGGGAQCQQAAQLLATCYADQRSDDMNSPGKGLSSAGQASIGGRSDPYEAVRACEFYLANWLLCIDRVYTDNGAQRPSLLGGPAGILGTLLEPVSLREAPDTYRASDTPPKTRSILFCMELWHRYYLAMRDDTACFSVCAVKATGADALCPTAMCRALFQGATEAPSPSRRSRHPDELPAIPCAASLLDTLAQVALHVLAGGDNATAATSLTAPLNYQPCLTGAEALRDCLRSNVAVGGGVLGPVRNCRYALRTLADCIGGAPAQETAEVCVARDVNYAVRCAPMVDVDYRAWFFNTTNR